MLRIDYWVLEEIFLWNTDFACPKKLDFCFVKKHYWQGGKT
jgi:hypothetical protein